MLYINGMTDKAVELAIEEVGKDSGTGGLIKTLYEEVKRLKGIRAKITVDEGYLRHRLNPDGFEYDEMNVKDIGYYAMSEDKSLFKFTWTPSNDLLILKSNEWTEVNSNEYKIVEIGIIHDIN